MAGNQPYVAAADSVPASAVQAGTGTSMQMLIGSDRAANFVMRRFTIEPGGSMPNHTNTVEHEQYVLSGAAEIGINGAVHTVRPGDVVFIPAMAPHWYRTLGDEPFRFLCLVPNQPDQVALVAGD